MVKLKLVVNNYSREQKPFRAMLKEEAKQFCLNTALHGYRFIVLPKRILLERVMWAIVCLVSLIAALTLLCIAWFNFQENPTVLVTDSTHFPIWNYPFPAITICSFNKISKIKALRLARNLNDPNGRKPHEIAWDLRLLVQLINHDNLEISERNYSRVQEILDSNYLSVREALKYMAPNCEEMLNRCKWKGEEKRCESIFEQVLTSEGYCCAFNYFALKNHTFSGTLANKAPKIPRRVSACGYQTALEVLVNNNPNDYYASNIPSIGHRILLHNPYFFPDWTVQSIMNEMKIVNLIAISPTITYSSKHIKKMPLNARQCLFPDERDLNIFQVYSFHNCMVECRINLTIKLCRCIPYFYADKNGDKNKEPRICSLRDLACLHENQHLIKTSVPGFDFSTIKSDHEFGTETSQCDCLPDCEYAEYIAESSSGELNREYSINQISLYGGLTINNHSVFRVFFNDLVAIKNRRDVIFSWHTLLAYYGGLLGLFIGFSFVSAVEIVYFFTIRLMADITKNNKAIIEEAKKPQKHHNQKRNVQTVVYDHLDPKKLMVHVDTEVRRRSNSNSWYME